jgi:hypothetical protein
MQTNCLAIAKVAVNKKLNTLRLVFSFDTCNKITVRNAAYVTGDICGVDYENADAEIAKAVEAAKKVLSTDNIVVVRKQ